MVADLEDLAASFQKTPEAFLGQLIQQEAARNAERLNHYREEMGIAEEDAAEAEAERRRQEPR